MPTKPLRPCRHPGCCALTASGYCEAHQPIPRDRSEEAKSWRWMYRTPTWARLRPDHLAAEPFCRECAKRGERVRATDVDHIRDHKGDWSLFSDPENLQSLCHSCHSRKTATEMAKSLRARRRLAR